MKLRVAVPAVLLMLASVVVPAQADNFVYFSETAGSCAMETVAYPGQTFSVFVLLDDPAGVGGVSFRLDTNRFDAADVQSVTPRPGVSILEGNIFDGITLSMDGREFTHEPVLDVVLSGHEATGYVWTRDIKVIGGASKDLSDQVTVAQASDCFGSTPVWDVPNAVEVIIGLSSEMTFMAGLNDGSYPPSAEVRVVDTAGWVDDTAAYAVEVVCGWCPWSGTNVTVSIDVPANVPNNTDNVITLEMWSTGAMIDSRTMTLRAVSAVKGEESTWGQIKSLYQ